MMLRISRWQLSNTIFASSLLLSLLCKQPCAHVSVFRAHTFQEVEVPRQRAPAFNTPLMGMASALCAVPGAAETSEPRRTNVFAHVDLTLQWGMFPGFICWIHCIPIRGQGSAGGETLLLYCLSDFPGQGLEWSIGDCVGGDRCSGSALISGDVMGTLLRGARAERQRLGPGGSEGSRGH